MSRVIIDLRDAAGRLDVLEVAIHQNLVECWLSDRCRGVFDRHDLRTWLDTGTRADQDETAAEGPDAQLLASRETRFSRTDGGVVTVSIDGAVTGWPLAAHVLVDLRSRL